jgi:serine/threonine protein kinase
MASEPLFCPHCGAVYALDEKQCNFCQYIFTEELDSFDPSDLFHERYQILNQIGTGGFGAVYQARDTQVQQRLVAIKQINLRGLTAQEIIEATDGFNRERQFLSSLTHNHLPRIYDHFMDAEHWYLIMEFIDGETLETYLQSMSATASLVRTLSVDEIVDVGLQLCDVLGYLHRQLQPIIFRDLKPSNVMRTALGALYLIDFGIARYFKPGKLKDTIPLGSPGYAAPEQYGKGQTTAQADIYSLGALLYYMLSGLDPVESPFHFAPLRLYGTAGLAELEALIMQMVALDAQQRPSDVQVVTLELQQIRRLYGSSEQRIWRPPISVAPAAGPLPYRPGFTGQSGQQQSQMYQPFAQPQGAGTKGMGRRTLIKRGWQIGLAVGIGSILLHNVIVSSHPLHASIVGEVHDPIMKYLSSASEANNAAVTKIVHSPVGHFLAVADQDRNVSIWSTTTLVQVDQLSMPLPVTALSWSLDNKYLSVASGRSVYIWSVPPTEDAMDTWASQNGPWIYQQILPAIVQTISWSPDDLMTIAVGDIDGNVQVFTILDGNGAPPPIYRLDANLLRNLPLSGPQTVALSWFEGRLYSLFDRNHVDVWTPPSPTNSRSIAFSGLMESIQAVLWLSESAAHLTAVVLTTDGQVSFADENYHASQSSLAGTFIKALVYSENLRYIFGLANEGIYVWPLRSVREQPKFFAQQDTLPLVMQSIDYVSNSDGNFVIVGGEEGALQKWMVQ